VTPRPYTRYTLRLTPAAAAAGDVAGAAHTAGAPLDDDWSGAAARQWHPDPAVLEYAHPEAVALVAALQPTGWQEEDAGDSLIFWLEKGREDEVGVARALAALGRLGRLTLAPEGAGWDEAWKRFHRPHVVGRLYLRPPWYPAREDLLDVVVDAGPAFGTGGHATTRQCLAMLQDVTPGALLDLGCGSGVVAFAARRLGFAPVWGIDNDPEAVEAAEANAARNGLAPAFTLGDAIDPAAPLPAADTVVANIALQPILRLAPRFAAGKDGALPELRPAHLLLAGLLLEQGDEAAAAFPEYEVAGRLEEEMWLLLHLTRQG
jgi:ribosomal protein L11 methyltransferase